MFQLVKPFEHAKEVSNLTVLDEAKFEEQELKTTNKLQNKVKIVLG